jgi:hypothetical protein
MVYGYPYTTNEYLPSFMIELIAGEQYPERIKIRQEKLDIIGAAMDADPKVRIQYSSKYARISNAWKKWIGVIKGLNRFDAIEKKQALEKDFMKWAQTSPEGEKYETLLDEYKNMTDNLEGFVLWADYFYEAIYSTDIFNFANRFRNLARLDKENDEDLTREKESLASGLDRFFKDYDLEVDKKLFTAMMKMFYEGIEASERPDIYQLIGDKHGNDFESYTEWVYDNTMFTDRDELVEFIENYKPSKAKKLEKDPVYRTYMSFRNYYGDYIAPEVSQLIPLRDSLQRVYMAGLMEFMPEKLFYSDANATMRLTYGLVNDYKPQDAVHYRYFTTLEGIMEKDNPEIYDYDVPDKLKDLYAAADYGPYARNDGSMPVCFIAMNHTTGGNSGSPVLNAEGHLLGLNFDRNWEGTMSDFMYDPEVCRNITLDIRYCLFIIDKFAGAGHLVEEMTVVE